MTDTDEIDAAALEERPSRSARKRAAEAMQKLGERLIRLKPADLEALQLPPTLLEAISEARRLRSRAALARQRQYIGKLMRDVDPVPIERALAAHTGGYAPVEPHARAKIPP